MSEAEGRERVAEVLQACAAGTLPSGTGGQGSEDEGSEAEASPEELKEQGNALFKAKKYKEALECYGEAVEVELVREFAGGRAFASQLYCNRSLCQLKLGDHDAALVDAGRAVQMDRNNPKAFFRKGKAFYELGRYEDAFDCLDRAQQLSPAADAALEALIVDCERRLPKRK